MVSALAEIRHLGCSFIVGGREDAGGRFLTLEGVMEKSGLPESLRGELEPSETGFPEESGQHHLGISGFAERAACVFPSLRM